MQRQKQKRIARTLVIGTLMKGAALCATTFLIAACVVEPYPPPPPPVAEAPGYYPGPYSYYDYPPYPGYVYGGPPVGFVFGGGGGWHGGRWR